MHPDLPASHSNSLILLAATIIKLVRVPLQLVTSANKELREDLNKLCLDPRFKDLLSRFSAQRLVQRLEVYQARVDAVLRSKQPAVAVQSGRWVPQC